MAKDILSDHNFVGGAKITGLPAAVAAGHAVEFAQFLAAIEGLAWKDDVRLVATTNVTIATPGATINGVTMAAGDRMLLTAETAPADNGIYIWNGAAVPATRAPDMSSSAEFNSAVVTATEGTANPGTTWRQTAVNPTVGTTAIVFTSFQTAAPSSSETVAGILEIATQAETDAGTDDARAVTPLKLTTFSGKAKRYAAQLGDGSATSIAITHNLNTRDVNVQVYKNAGNYDTVDCECQRTSVNQITLIFATAPASNALRVIVVA